MVNVFKIPPREIVEWRKQNRASFSEAAEHFGCSVSTVTRAERLIKAEDKPPAMSPEHIKELRDSLNIWLNGLLDLQAEIDAMPDGSPIDCKPAIQSTLQTLRELDELEQSFR